MNTAEWERFVAKFVVDARSKCWVWKGARSKCGYGNFGMRVEGGRITARAHRACYEHFRGPIPTGLVTDHLCKNTLCVNPAHLEAVTIRENVLRSDGWAAHKSRQTHCIRGHELSEDNIRRPPNRPTSRECKVCRAERVKVRLELEKMRFGSSSRKRVSAADKAFARALWTAGVKQWAIAEFFGVWPASVSHWCTGR